jgi:large subunit ribosomal protein L23
MAKLAQDIVIKPLITEKSMLGVSEKKYSFEVHKDATKPEIAKAVETLFKVSVKKVNTVHTKGHFRRYGKYSGYKPDRTKAVVTLTEKSDSIAFFDGMV